MTDPDTTSLNIVILPDEDVRNAAIDLSQKVSSKIDSYFSLNNTSFKPHITIYQGCYPNKNLQQLYSNLENFLQKVKPLSMNMTTYQISLKTFIHWGTEKTNELQAFHESILSLANPYREGLIPPGVKALFSELDDEKKAIVESTGSILNKNFFNPHITITRIKNPKDGGKVLEILGKEKAMTFTPSKLVVAQLGNHGTISEVVKEFSFGEN